MMLRVMFTALALVWFCVQVWFVWYVAKKEYEFTPEPGVPSVSVQICDASLLIDAVWLFTEGCAVALGFHGLLIPVANAVLTVLPKWLYVGLPSTGIITGIITRWLSRKDVWDKHKVPKYAWVSLVLTSYITLVLALTQIAPAITKAIIDSVG